jgi:hypothetical protein
LRSNWLATGETGRRFCSFSSSVRKATFIITSKTQLYVLLGRVR